jgi:glycerol-3-phosphate dehydrogenase subunit B
MHISLRDAIGCPVHEVAGLPPSLPGQRLAKALLNYLRSRGVEVIMGCTIKDPMVSGGRCRWVASAGGGGRTMQIWAEVFVLATGSFLGGGLEASPETVREAVFNLPVKIPPGEWAARDFLSMDGHAFIRTGIEVNNNLQPVGRGGQVLVENILVAGANLSGCNYPIEKCGNGVALATGYKAGRLAGRWAGGQK